MSLDVYLTQNEPVKKESSGIFVREAGATKEITRAEWDARFPGREPFAVQAEETNQVFHANITHNMNKMAEEAGIYKELWRPEEIGITKAHQLVRPLALGLNRMVSDPDRYKAFNPANGWGSYEALIEFVASYIAACCEYPDAKVEVWR